MNKPFVGNIWEHDGNYVSNPSVRWLKRGGHNAARKKTMIRQQIPLVVIVIKGRGKKKRRTIITGVSRLQAQTMKVDGKKTIQPGRVIYHDPAAFDKRNYGKTR